ncbi:C-type lectin 37Db [Drosophila grimshawi]|uniref:GH19636 n=1 Tax=Drosophila grimshawi TaxID=7222 RepID=B4JRR6_DROGR|nr:C-type lectin 37Db [Drosophila grimshawi]EDV94456.1 GH19636 [Drosophila grimshawi]
MFKSSTVLIAVLLSLLAGSIYCSLSITCQKDEEQVYVKIGHKHYFIWHTKVTWLEAVHLCRRFGGDLVLIESAEELESISNYLIKHGYDHTAWLWTSGNDLVSHRQFKSINNGMPLPYTSWSSGQPDNAGGNEHCVHLWFNNRKSFQMNDWICHEKAQAICQNQNHTRCYESYH